MVKENRSIHRWVFEIPLSDVQDEGITGDGNNPCICCGKEMKPGKEKHLVHLLTNGNLVSTDEEIENSQGFFPIGTECKNRLPNNFIFKAKTSNG